MRFTAIALIFSVVTFSASDVFAQTQEAAAWRQVAEAIPLGSKVKIQTHQGKRINGTLMRADATSVMLKRNTRRPEPAIIIPYDEIAKLERDHGGGGINVAKAIAVGAGVGAGVIMTMILFAMQLD